MYLLTSWKDSLKIFLPKNLKLFLLVTLKSIVETYEVWLKNFWWLVLIYPVGFLVLKLALHVNYSEAFLAELLGLGIVAQIMERSSLSEVGLIFSVMGTMLGYLTQLTMILAMRPSVSLKNISYFWRYKRHILHASLWVVGLNALFLFLLLSIILTLGGSGLLDAEFYAFGLGLISLLILFFVHFLFLLFLFDSDARLNNVLLSIVRAIKMFFYNLPFFVIMVVPVSVIMLGTSWLTLRASIFLRIINEDLSYVVYVTFFVIPVGCLITNFYIKRLREQFSLYYKVKSQ